MSAAKKQNEYRGHDGRWQFFGDFDRMCVCGHALGVHLAGGWDCINQDVGDDHKPCDCKKFRPSRARRSKP